MYKVNVEFLFDTSKLLEEEHIKGVMLVLGVNEPEEILEAYGVSLVSQMKASVDNYEGIEYLGATITSLDEEPVAYNSNSYEVQSDEFSELSKGEREDLADRVDVFSEPEPEPEPELESHLASEIADEIAREIVWKVNDLRYSGHKLESIVVKSLDVKESLLAENVSNSNIIINYALKSEYLIRYLDENNNIQELGGN